jgi:hypothetical protein
VPKRQYNVKGVESGGGDFVPLKPGLYQMKVVEAVTEKPDGKDERVHVQLEVVADSKGKKVKPQDQGYDKSAQFGRIHDYVNLESEAAAFKLAQYLEATGKVDRDKPKTEKGTFDPDKEWPGKIILVRVKADSWQGEPTAKAGNILPLPEDAEPEDEDGDEDEDEDSEDEDDDDSDEDDSDDDDDDSDDEDDEDEDDEAWTEEELGEEDDDSLESIAFDDEEGYGLDKKGMYTGKGKKKKLNRKKVIAAILEAQEEDDDEDDEDEDGNSEEQDYSEMSLDDLKSEVADRELEVKGKATKKKLIELLKADDEEDPF